MKNNNYKFDYNECDYDSDSDDNSNDGRYSCLNGEGLWVDLDRDTYNRGDHQIVGTCDTPTFTSQEQFEIYVFKYLGKIHPDCLRTDGYEPDAEDEARDDWAAREDD